MSFEAKLEKFDGPLHVLLELIQSAELPITDVLEATYRTMGYSKEELESSVGHMLEAFRFGAPPHGGIALGVERNLMNLTGESALREVVAFPMTASGTTSVMEAPTTLDVETLLELSIKTTEKKV